MDSRGRRTPRMAGPIEAPAPRAGAAVPDPVTADPPVDELPAPPHLIEQRISPPETALAALTAPPALPAPAPLSSAAATGDILDVITESRTALARGVESLSEEFASFTRRNIDTTARSAVQMLVAKTWADALAVNTSFARTSFDHWLDSTAKVSELGVKLAVESSKLFVTRLGKAWSGARPGW
jgi:Phasin protein